MNSLLTVCCQEPPSIFGYYSSKNDSIMSKLDLFKTDKTYYKASKKPVEVQLSPVPYLSIKGISAPEDPLFDESVAALYAVAYALKFQYKAQDQDFVVAKMEGQWWVEDARPFPEVPRTEWHWNVLIRLPEFVQEADFKTAKSAVAAKKNPKHLESVQWQIMDEAHCVQMLHLGSYDAEEETLRQITTYMEEQGLTYNGYHHEIYLNDPRRTPEEKLRTIIRYPVKPAQAS